MVKIVPHQHRLLDERSPSRRVWMAVFWYLLYPVDCIDLKTGRPDHDRLMATGIGVVFAILLLRSPAGTWPPTVLAMGFLAGAYGVRLFTKFLVRSKLGATDETVHTIQETVARPFGGSAAHFDEPPGGQDALVHPPA